MITIVNLNTIIVPYTYSDPSAFRIVSAGGKSFPITSVVDNGDGTTTLTSSQDLAGTYYVGLDYEMRYKLGNLVIKPANQDGRTQSTNLATKDNLATMTFAYTDAVTFNVEIEAPKRPVRTVSYTSKQMGFSNIGEADLREGEFRFHLRGKTRDTKVTVTDSSVFPCQLQHVEIERNISSRSKR